jgi:hypothetical protein
MARAIKKTLEWMKENPGKVGVVRLNVKAPRKLIFGQKETKSMIYYLHIALYGIMNKTSGPKVWSNRVKFDSATLLEMWGREVMPFTFLQLQLARFGITMVDVGGTSRDQGFEPKICLSLDPAQIQIGTADRFHGLDRKPVDLKAPNLDAAIATFLTEVNKEISPILAELRALEGRFDLVKPPVKAAEAAEAATRPPVKAVKAAEAATRPPVKAAEAAGAVARPPVKAAEAATRPPVKAAKAAEAAKPAVTRHPAKPVQAAKAAEADEADILRQEIELRELKLKLARLLKK